MSTTPSAILSTGVSGLDHVLHGGFRRRGFYLIQGAPGSGKTTLALQFLFEHTRLGRKSLYVSLTESYADLENACDSHGWSIDQLEICDLTKSAANMTGVPEYSVFHPADTELGETTKAIFEAVDRCNPECVVFDGLSEMRILSGNALLYRRQLLALKEYFFQREATVVLLDDGASPFGVLPPESLVGGNIVLERELPAYGRARRRLCVTKVRGSSFREGFHDYEISSGGMNVYPRLVAAEHDTEFASTEISSGIEHLDEMLGGGLTTGSTAILLGPAGTGKSTVAMQFAISAMRAGQPAAVFIFDEVLRIFLQRINKLILKSEDGLNSFLTSGLLHARQVDPSELTPGAFAHNVKRAVDAGTKVVILDSLNGYLSAMPNERFLTSHLHELFAYLNHRGVTAITTVAQHGLLVGHDGSNGIDASYLADTVLLFRYFEARGQIRKALSVLKKRTGFHQRSLRELQIDSNGIQVGGPLEMFRGIMTGVPLAEDNTPLLEST